MRIALSGTHASGKTRLIDDYCVRRPETLQLGDPFELLDAASDPPGATEYLAQLRIAEVDGRRGAPRALARGTDA